MYLEYVNKTYQLLPGKYKQKVRPFLLLSLVNLLLDLFSLAIVIPLIFMIVDKDAFVLPEIFRNYISGFDNPVTIAGIIIMVLVVFIIKNSLSIKIINYQTKTCFELASEVSLLFMSNYLLNDFKTFKKQSQPELIRNSIEIPNEFIVYIIIALNTILSELILLILIFLSGLLINPIITFYLFIILLFAIIITQGIGRDKIRSINNNLADDYAGNISNLFNLMKGFLEIKTAAREAYFLEKFADSNKILNKNYAMLYARNLLTPKYIEVILITIIGSVIVLYNYIPQSDHSGLLYISFLAAAAMKVIPSVNKVITSFTNYKSHLFTVDIIKEKLSRIAKIKSSSPLSFQKHLQVKDLSFSYNDQPLLNNLNLTVKKGEIVAISGKSGVGKSTLFNVITQLLKADKGSICIDDTEITPENNSSFLKFISYLPQDPFILEGSILENITMGRTEYDKEKLAGYLAEFDMEKVINALPQKLDTYIGNNGHYLSGGQKQRIALIRALLHQPQILILDEASNQLESELERKILKKLYEIAKNNNTTVLLVSHHAENISAISDTMYTLKAKGLEKQRAR